MASHDLFVVPGDRHVERLVREGQRAETRTSLRSRLAAALLPETAFVDPRECRLVLAMALADWGGFGAAAPQLDLFAGGAAADSPRAATAGPPGDALLVAAHARGGASWARLVAALDDAISLLRARRATADDLDRVARSKGFLATRAKTLAAALRALDARLARAKAHDGRLLGVMVADAIAVTPPEELEAIVGARRLRARWLLAWEPSDVAWWRALDDRLAPRGGGARVVLPTFDRPLAGSRERDPLDALADEVAGALDAPTESETIAAVLGDLTGVPPLGSGSGLDFDLDLDRVRLVGASDAVAQARAVATHVSESLAAGAAVERIVIAFPVMDERTLAPLRRALDEEGIVFHEARGAPPSAAPVVTAALLALDAATSLDRHRVARLLRSGWIDAARLLGEERRPAERRLARLARALETSATAAGTTALERLVRTATTRFGPARPGDMDVETERAADAEAAARVGALLSRSRAGRTRAEHVRATRALWAELGIGARAGRGGLAAFTSDAAPQGVSRAERLAIARDARAWDSLIGALDLHETLAHRVGALEQTLDAEMFRLELVELLDAASSQPGGGRAAAVRIARLGDVAGDALDLLVVVDANEGILPRDDAHDVLVSEALADAIRRASHGSFVAPAPGSTRAREMSALAVASADAERVVLVFSREDASGGPLAASPVVDALERAGAVVVSAEAEPVRRSGFEVELRAAREREREAFFLDPLRPRSDVVGDLAPGASAAGLLFGETGGAQRSLAVTGLERFARCPFMGFAHVVLAARETELKDELPDAREEGTLVHEVLAAAFVATRELWARRPRPADAIVHRGVAAADLVLDEWQGHAPLRAIVRLRVRDAVRAVLGVALADETWDFALAEQSFGARTESTWTALELLDPEDGARLSLRGSIDRIDRAHDGRATRVVDYKRSKSTVRGAASSLGETALQVPLYACVTRRELGAPATGIYVPTQARDVALEAKPNARAGQRMDELVARPPGAALAEIERRALDIARGVRSGALAPLPAKESECGYCAVSGGCRKPRFAMAPVEEVDDDSDGGGAVRPTP